VLLAVTDAQERITTRDDLAGVSEAFLASSAREVQPVHAIDGAPVAAAPGPISADAAVRVREHIQAVLGR
jgi:branched-chain amino acid aminotransferase